ncbi:MAG: hypothetical protein KKB70_02770, partial [Proteobacteria bacterium]|nr:hypothetical protein [Pseudomonadota bacterium]MBU1612726.1 hypothetical protein [Pseudomonadota bacterium]
MKIRQFIKVYFILACMVFVGASAGTAFADCGGGKDTAWNAKTEREVKGKVADAKNKLEAFKDAMQQVKYNPEDLNAKRDADFALAELQNLLGEGKGFIKETNNARFRNDTVAVNNYKKYESKLNAIRDELGAMGIPLDGALTDEGLSEQQFGHAAGLVNSLNEKVEALKAEVQEMAKDGLTTAEQKDIVDKAEAIATDAENLSSHFSELSAQAHDLGMSNMGAGYASFSEA